MTFLIQKSKNTFDSKGLARTKRADVKEMAEVRLPPGSGCMVHSPTVWAERTALWQAGPGARGTSYILYEVYGLLAA